MATKTIAHALFTWQENGTRHTAYHGQHVEIPDDIVVQFQRFGVFADDTPNEDPDDEPPAPDTDADTTALDHLPPRPRTAAAKSRWVDYADTLHQNTSGEYGLARPDAEALSKDELIDELATQIEQETNHG